MKGKSLPIRVWLPIGQSRWYRQSRWYLRLWTRVDRSWCEAWNLKFRTNPWNEIHQRKGGALTGPATSKWDLWWSFRCAVRVVESCGATFVVVVVQPSCEEEPGDVSLSTYQFFLGYSAAHCSHQEMPPTHWWKTWWRFCRTVASWGLNDCHGNAKEEQKSKTAVMGERSCDSLWVLRFYICYTSSFFDLD